MPSLLSGNGVKMTHGNDELLWTYVFLPILTLGLCMPKELKDNE